MLESVSMGEERVCAGGGLRWKVRAGVRRGGYPHGVWATKAGRLVLV